MTNHLLQLHLQATIPLLIDEFLTGQRELVMPRPDLAQTIARYGDHILYQGDHTAEAVTALAEAVATLAFCPGGVTCFGLHFEVPPEQAREIEAVDVLWLDESWCELAAAVENPPDSLQLSLFEEPPRVTTLANLYRDFLSVVNGDESAYPSTERLARYQRWAASAKALPSVASAGCGWPASSGAWT